MKVLHKIGPVLVKRQPVDSRQERYSVRQALLLGNVGNHVLAEAVYTHVQPETHDFLDFLAHFRVVHV